MTCGCDEKEDLGSEKKRDKKEKKLQADVLLTGVFATNVSQDLMLRR